MEHAHGSPAPGAPRAFYEGLAGRTLERSTIRGIAYRNLVVARHVRGRGLRILEVGPGEGWLTGILAGRGHRVIAVDLSRPWLAAIPAGATAGKAAAEMTHLPFADANFDAVVAAEVIEHIPDMAGALAEAARVLAPGGRLVVTVPYRETLQFTLCPDCGIRYEVNGHVRSFDETVLEDALRVAGLLPERRFVGPTRFSREILRRAPIAPLLPVLNAIDRASYRSQRVSDTWMLVAARRP
jgi:SAM-dependent methyltransferase